MKRNLSISPVILVLYSASYAGYGLTHAEGTTRSLASDSSARRTARRNRNVLGRT